MSYQGFLIVIELYLLLISQNKVCWLYFNINEFFFESHIFLYTLLQLILLWCVCCRTLNTFTIWYAFYTTRTRQSSSSQQALTTHSEAQARMKSYYIAAWLRNHEFLTFNILRNWLTTETSIWHFSNWNLIHEWYFCIYELMFNVKFIIQNRLFFVINIVRRLRAHVCGIENSTCQKPTTKYYRKTLSNIRVWLCP